MNNYLYEDEEKSDFEILATTGKYVSKKELRAILQTIFKNDEEVLEVIKQ